MEEIAEYTANEEHRGVLEKLAKAHEQAQQSKFTGPPMCFMTKDEILELDDRLYYTPVDDPRIKYFRCIPGFVGFWDGVAIIKAKENQKDLTDVVEDISAIQSDIDSALKIINSGFDVYKKENLEDIEKRMEGWKARLESVTFDVVLEPGRILLEGGDGK